MSKIHLKTGKGCFTYEAGTTLEAISRDFQEDYPHDIILARVDGKLAELNSCIAGAKAEFKSLPESQQTQARKISIVLARSGRLYAMQASYDREVESIVSQMRAILTANGQGTALADQAMASYKAQKSAMYSRLTAKLYS